MAAATTPTAGGSNDNETAADILFRLVEGRDTLIQFRYVRSIIVVGLCPGRV